MRKLQTLDFRWKLINPYFLRCRYKHPSVGFEVKIDLQLYQIDQRNYLLDFKSVDPSVSGKEREGEEGEEESEAEDSVQEEQSVQRHYTMEFFEACSRLISALAQ